MYGKKQWKGREVEGRYSDMMTYFVRELMINENTGRLMPIGIDGIDVDKLTDYPHYYFTVEYMQHVLKDAITGNTPTRELDIIRKILDTTNCVVTIETNDVLFNLIPTDLFNRCHVIYRIQSEIVQKLKDTDTLSIDAGWYRCHMVAKMHFQETTPASYKYDENEL